MNNYKNKLFIKRISNLLPSYQLKRIRYNQNSINGVLENNTKKYFFKISLTSSVYGELIGQEKYSKYNKCPKVNMLLNIGGGYSIILFEYMKSLDKGRQELYYALECKNNKITEVQRTILNYFKTFQNRKFVTETSDEVNNSQYSLFFKQRVNRVKNIETDDINFKQIILKSASYIENMALEKLRFLTHGDPSDMNFCSNNLFFDFEEVGYNDIALEFAIIFWNFFIGGSYLYPKYYHYKYLDKKTADNKFLVITENRKNILLFIISEMEKIYNQNELIIGEKFIYCLIFRILSVIPFGELDVVDQKLLTDHVKMLYDWTLQTEISIFKKLSKWVIGE